MIRHEIMSRAEARERGLSHYFTGEPCKHGHLAIRRTNDCICSECHLIIQARWREENREKHNSWCKNNPEKHRENNKKYRETHPERRTETNREYLANNREKHRTYQRGLKKKRRQDNPDYRFRCNLRGRIHKALRRGDWLKSGKTLDLIGCTVAELRAHLESQFTAGMSWDNYGHGVDKWNIDHITPCAAFDLSDIEKHFTNLQPLWHVLNVEKGDSIDYYGSEI